MKFDCPLRPFQVEAGKAWRGHVAAGRQRGLVSIPTGCGKTVYTLSLVPESGRTLFLVHRDTLATQTIRAAKRVIDGIECGIVMADRDDIEARDLVVASVPTLARQPRLDRLIESQAQYGKFRFVVADEAHHAAQFPRGRQIVEVA